MKYPLLVRQTLTKRDSLTVVHVERNLTHLTHRVGIRACLMELINTSIPRFSHLWFEARHKVTLAMIVKGSNISSAACNES